MSVARFVLNVVVVFWLVVFDVLNVVLNVDVVDRDVVFEVPNVVVVEFEVL